MESSLYSVLSLSHIEEHTLSLAIFDSKNHTMESMPKSE